MRIPGVEFQCGVCGAWSDDNESCSACGAKMPPDDSLDGLFVPGFELIPAEQQDAAMEQAAEAQSRWIERFRHEQELRQTEPGYPADDRTRPWTPTHRVRGCDGAEGSLLMVLPNGQSFTRESWDIYRAGSAQWSMYFNSPWVFWRGVWYLDGSAVPAGTVVEVDVTDDTVT